MAEDTTAALIGNWVPQPIRNCWSFEVNDYLMYRGWAVGMVCGGDGRYFPMVMGVRLGVFDSLELSRRAVERYVKLAQPFLNAIMDRNVL